MEPRRSSQPGGASRRRRTDSGYKPLFNRKFLLLLVVILPLVILLLNRSGQPPDPLARLTHRGDLYQLLKEQPDYRLHLLLVSAPNLSDRDWIEIQLQRARIAQGLHSGALRTWLSAQQWRDAAVDTRPGYLLLSFTLPDPPTAAQRSQLLSLLQQLPAPEPALTTRLQAQRYLDQQAPEQQLLGALGERLAARPTAPVTDTPAWTLVGPQASQPAALATSSPRPPAVPITPLAPAEQQLPSARGNGWHLLAETLPPPRDARELALQRITAELVSRLLAVVTTDAAADYRWLWQPLPYGGYQALLLRQADTGLLARPGEQLAARLDQATLEQTRQALLERLEALVRDDPQQWLDLLALYQLPVDSDKVFRATLELLDLDSARTRVAQTLPADRRLHLRFASTGTPSP